MLKRDFRDRLAALTDELLADQDVEAAFLASVLLRAQDALEDGTIASLGLRLWRSDPDREVDCLRAYPDAVSGGRSPAGAGDPAGRVKDRPTGSRKGRITRTPADPPRRRTGGA